MVKENGLLTIEPTWPVPEGVHAITTTRIGGVSQDAYQSLNLAQHVADDSHLVIENRQLLKEALKLPAEPAWLNQVHGTSVCEITSDSQLNTPEADAAWTKQPGVVCAVLTADCLPLLLTDTHGKKVAAVHAGWRGLLSGVVEVTTKTLMKDTEATWMAWLGPAIGPEVFEVGQEVYEAFRARDAGLASAFKPRGEKWLMDIYSATRHILNKAGVTQVYGGDYCTYQDSRHFYSYRRSATTGRMATLIWKD